MQKILPPKTKRFKKTHKVKFVGSLYKKYRLGFQEISFLANQSSYVTLNQIESARRVLSRFFKMFDRKNCLSVSVIICVMPRSSVTKKSVGSRMGKGVGKHKNWVVLVERGCVVYEVRGMIPTCSLFSSVFKDVKNKFPIGLTIVINIKDSIC